MSQHVEVIGLVPVPEYATVIPLASPEEKHFNLDLMTPPVSNETVRPAVRFGTETPRSHRTSSLNRQFKKCCIYSDDTATLTPIEEDHLSDKAQKRSITALQRTPKKLQRNMDDFEWISEKPQISITPCVSPSNDQKDNSPIKIENVRGSSWTLHIPPRKLNTLTNGANGRMDILTSLYNNDLHFIIKKVMNYLDPLDLVAMKNVSANWRQFASQIVPRALENAEKLALRSRENLPYEKKPKHVVKSRNETTPLKSLALIENRIPSPKRRLMQSPELSPDTKRFRYYVKAGKDLKENERLERCSKCRYPARTVDGLASCSRCNYKFCSKCHCPPHPDHTCKLLFSPSTSPEPLSAVKIVPVGSKQSKKSLSRLLKM